MAVQVKIDPTTGLTKCGNSIEKEDSTQCLFSTTMNTGKQGWGLGIPNVLRNAEQILTYSMKNKSGDFVEACYDPHAYWSVDNRPKGTKQIVDSGIFSYLYGQYSNTATMKDIDRYADFYIEFVNNHFKQHCITNNTPWFVELDIHGRFPLEDYHRIQKKLLDSCPNRDFIGVWHCEHGLKNLEDICEKFDYIAISVAKGDKEIKWQGMHWLQKNHPEKIVHALGTLDIERCLAPELLCGFVDTCDSTYWSEAAKYGLKKACAGCRYERGAWVAPAIKWCNENWFKWFPKYISPKSKLEHNEWGYSTGYQEISLWLVCRVWCIWSYANLFGHQKQWENAGFRRAMVKILEGKGGELNDSDIDPFLYEMPHQITIGDSPRIFNVAEGYQDKFKGNVKTLFNL